MPVTDKQTSHKKPDEHNTLLLAKVAGSGAASISELTLFHPFDTAVKRWQKESVRLTQVTHSNQIRRVIFQSAYRESPIKKISSLYSGLSSGAVYKITQRVYKFAGQPIVMDYLKQSALAGVYRKHFGEHADPLLRATAGSIIGAGEVALLPLDALKIKCQTSKERMSFSAMAKLVKQEKFNLYNGASWTFARNVPGSFFLFGGDAVMKQYVFGLKNHRDATPTQTFVASAVGTFFSISFTNPLDVIKTRIQARQGTVHGMSIFKQTVSQEGLPAFFRGTTLKLLTAGPKVTVSLALAQLFTNWFDKEIRSAQELRPENRNTDATYDHATDSDRRASSFFL